MRGRGGGGGGGGGEGGVIKHFIVIQLGNLL